MSSFQLLGLPADVFSPLFALSDDELIQRGMRRVFADQRPGFPCRVSLSDAEVGEELCLLPFEHQPASSPYRASGPIFVRRNASQAILPPGIVPDYVRSRLMSVRAYDAQHLMIDAAVCEGHAAAVEIERQFADARVDYLHLHNAKRGCFSCLVRRVS